MLSDAPNFSIWALLLNIKAVQFGPMVQRYIHEGTVFAPKVQYDKVKFGLDSICRTMVTGGLTSSDMEEVLYNQGYGHQGLLNLQKL